MKFVNVLSLSFLVFLFAVSCDTSEPPVQSTLVLKLEDVSCTEAWLQLTSTNIQLPNNISVLINGSVKKTFTLNSEDSLLYLDSLNPNQTYKIIAAMQQGNNASNELSVTTLDTTSHNFTWQTFEFGQHSSSILYDVAIIDENNIWAVGEIYMNDSLGNPDNNAYNAVHWNGTSWKLKRIPYYYNGQTFYSTIRAILTFNESDIWFGIASLIHWNGTVYHSISTQGVFPAQINKMWGTSSTNFYIVGTNGQIAHYNGTSWKKIESGTTTNINDAWGVSDNGNSIIYCPVSSVFNPPQDKKILQIIGNKVNSFDWSINRIVYSCWTNNTNFLYVCGEGVFVNKFGTWEQITLPAITTNSIRGNDINDVFAVGSLGTIFHFNGISWQIMSNYTQKENYRVDIKNNIVAICGYYNGKGFVEIGRRN